MIIWFLTSAMIWYKVKDDYWNDDIKEGNEVSPTVSLNYIFVTFFSNKPELKQFYIIMKLKMKIIQSTYMYIVIIVDLIQNLMLI
mgnify:CR=1 FL=1